MRMFLALLALFTSLGCLVVSFLALSIVIFHLYFSHDELIKYSRRDGILISGCDSGIGLELAKHFHREFDFKIIRVFLYPNQSDGYKELVDLSRLNDRLILLKLDLRSSEDISKVVEFIEKCKANKTLTNLVGLINNAGILTYGEFDWLTWNHIHDQIEVNLTGTIRLTRALVPYIIESKGRIINVSSVNDATVFPGLSIYSATKSAISTFSRGLGYELRKFGSHVVTVRLGDFAKLTNIMSKHSSNQEDMWRGMSDKKKDLYGDFFHKFNNHLMKNYGMTSPKEFEDSSLFGDFTRALMSKHPPTTITCTSRPFKIFYLIMELTPSWIQYHLLDLLLKFGFEWEPPQMR